MARKAIAAIAAAGSLLVSTALPCLADTGEAHSGKPVADFVIDQQQSELKKAATAGNSGPQSPRDIGNPKGSNKIVFSTAPDRSAMNLCNIHFHEAAEHRGGEFSTYIGNGDGKGHGTGYKFNGSLTAAELTPFAQRVGQSEHGEMKPGDTIEIHFVFSTAHVKPGPTLASCLSKENTNPQLRVETVVAVLVNDRKATDFTRMAKLSTVNGYSAAPNIPENLGEAVTYSGSTTGPGYNLKPSPIQVTWHVRPKVAKIDIQSMSNWLRSNPFNETHAHGVRNLVADEALLAPIQNGK